MKQIRLIILFIGTLIQTNVFSQQISSEKIIGTASYKRLNDASLYFDTYMDGEIILANNDTLTNLKLNYDCLAEELIWLRPEPLQPVYVNKESIKGFIILNNDNKSIRYFIKQSISTNQNTIEKYFEILKGDSIMLMASHKKEWINNTYSPYTIYYIKTPDTITSQFNTNRKSCYNLYPAIKPELKKIIKQSHLNANREKDLIKILIIIEQLIYKK